MIKVYNTLTRKKEFFRPLRRKKVNLFVCGPTVYDFSHIGHARTYIVFDLITKYLRENGYDVFYLQNITDIDNRIITRAKEEKVFWKILSHKFEKEYLKDMKTLNINSITKYARATEHIEEIISQVKRLLEKGFAYQTGDGIYYDISKFKDYGKLSKRTVLQAEDAVSRIDKSINKRNKGDFCLWKFSAPSEPRWKSLWGWGRPGWHIEDTAITEKYFGPQYDIHGGGYDLVFPHHEAEIAQMEAISRRKPLVKYWFHTGFLKIEGVKMSKSLGNFITIKDFLKDNSPRLLRFFVIKTHYRSPIDYSEKFLPQAKKEIKRIDEFIVKLKELSTDKVKSKKHISVEVKKLISKTHKEFKKSMEDDFNLPKVVAIIFELVNKGNSLIAQDKIISAQAKDILEFLKKIDKFLNFIFWRGQKSKISEEIIKLVKLREKYRKKRDWGKADRIREKIKSMGWWVKDTKKEPVIRQLKISD